MRPESGDLRAEVGELRTAVERLAVELAEMKAHAAALEALAHEDPLTGVHNRRGFVRDLTRAIAFGARYGTPAALLLADMDRFKPINDTYGHEVGDRALAHLAALLRRNVRASDSIGRLGGDEFALIIWQVDAPIALTKAIALEAMVAGSPLPHGEAQIPLSISVGCTMLEARDTPEAALARADREMYRRKAARHLTR